MAKLYFNQSQIVVRQNQNKGNYFRHKSKPFYVLVMISFVFSSSFHALVVDNQREDVNDNEVDLLAITQSSHGFPRFFLVPYFTTFSTTISDRFRAVKSH